MSDDQFAFLRVFMRWPGRSFLILAATWYLVIWLNGVLGVIDTAWETAVSIVGVFALMALVGASFGYVLTVLGAARSYWEAVVEPAEREAEREREERRRKWEREEQERRSGPPSEG